MEAIDDTEELIFYNRYLAMTRSDPNPFVK